MSWYVGVSAARRQAGQASATPTANAGADQTAATGKTVTLVGGGTTPAGTTITEYRWTLTEVPLTSTAKLSGTGKDRTFTADKAGTYRANLVVVNNLGLMSAADETVVTVADAASPTGTRRFGPTGLYWQPDTPLYDGSDSVHDIEVDPTEAAILAAIRGLTSSQVRDGVRLLVRPGTVPSVRDADGLTGDPAWPRRVLIRPRDGRSSVVLDSVAEGLNSVMWAGFYSKRFRIYGGINTGCMRIISHETLGNGNVKVYSRRNLPSMTGLYVGEIVRRGVDVVSSDAGDIWTFESDTGVDRDIIDPIFEGWWLSPNYKPEGSTHHTDTMQFEPFGATTNNAVFRGCAVFGSDNTALQINGIRKALFENCYVVSHGYQQDRYPYPAGADLIGEGKFGSAFNGGSSAKGFDHQLTLRKCTVIGRMTGSQTIVEVTDCIRRGTGGTSGGWTEIDGLTDGNYVDSPLNPDDTYLASIWGPA